MFFETFKYLEINPALIALVLITGVLALLLWLIHLQHEQIELLKLILKNRDAVPRQSIPERTSVSPSLSKTAASSTEPESIDESEQAGLINQAKILYVAPPATAEELNHRLTAAVATLEKLSAERSTLELTRKLACLQAEAIALQNNPTATLPVDAIPLCEEFQRNLGQFIKERFRSGSVPENPSSFVIDEIERLEGAIGNIDQYVKEQSDIGQAVIRADLTGITLEELSTIKAQADTAYAQLTDRQHELNNAFLNHDLAIVDGQVDVAPDLVAFCQQRKPDSKLLVKERPELCQFANGEGNLHGKVVEHLESVKDRSKTLLAEHEENTRMLEEARALAKEGNYDRAEQLLNKINPAFKDLEAEDLREEIEKWSKQIREFEQAFERLKAAIEEKWTVPFAQPWLVTARERSLRIDANDLRDHLAHFHKQISDSATSDSARKGQELYKRLTKSLNDIAPILRNIAGTTRAVAIGQVGIILIGLVALLLYVQNLKPFVMGVAGVLLFARLIQVVHERLLRRTCVEYTLEANGKTVDESENAFIYLNAKRVRSGSFYSPGTYELTLDASIYEPVVQMVRIRYGRRNRLGAIPVRLNRDSYTNGLGMKFVSVSGTSILFGTWPARVSDYQEFVKDSKTHWPKPRFKQQPDHPATNITWDEARQFCIWLTEKERTAGRIGKRDRYRLPSDIEWSAAAGVRHEKGQSPEERGKIAKPVYLWGADWPPPRGSGNFDPALNIDDYDFTSPVGSFKPTKNGIYDLLGNVWEWCEDLFEQAGKSRVLRGGSWHTAKPEMLSLSYRLPDSAGHRLDIIGFRCVIEVRRPSPLVGHSPNSGQAS